MFRWIGKLLRRRGNGHEPEVEQLEQRQAVQFSVWEDTMREVERVQHTATGKSRHTKRRAHR